MLQLACILFITPFIWLEGNWVTQDTMKSPKELKTRFDRLYYVHIGPYKFAARYFWLMHFNSYEYEHFAF